MGNAYSFISPGRTITSEGSISTSETMEDASISRNQDGESSLRLSEEDDDDAPDKRKQLREEDMNKFRMQLDIKREQRKEILTRHRTEKEKLKQMLTAETKSKLKLIETNKVLCDLLRSNNIEVPDNLQCISEDTDVINTVSEMREELDNIKSFNIKLRRDLADTNGALQEAYSEIADLSAQNTESIKQINALKEVISVSKSLIGMREQQLNELKNKLNEIEKSLADREASMLSNDLRQEYERQLQNIRTLRGLYEERARLAEVTRQGLLRELEEHKALSLAESKKSEELAEKVQKMEKQIDDLKETVESKSDQIRSSRIETQDLKSEMSAVNKLFSQFLLGYKNEQNLDTLVQRLEENHGILTQMAEKENGSEVSSALPKLFLELVSQVENIENNDKHIENCSNDDIDQTHAKQSPNTTAEEIVQNLPKVWKVLMELLSHQNIHEEAGEKVTTCYKSIETNSGPVLIPSVSQTYIRLKDLIIEKLSLIKEVNRMKQLNTHLESRLEEQEKRLCLVTTELSKTWHVVGRLRRHHHQLHTHEKILKYELQQKRKLLNELKEELEYCREKWDQAREKNTQSEKDWRKLRAEFSSRKTKSDLSSLNNSAESGYSDERPSEESSESNDESEFLNEPSKCVQKNKNSFVVDSSADFNIAEREDPVSDMLDVAELPLDSQDGDETQDNSECCSTSYHSISEKRCVETEDEAADISIEAPTQDENELSSNSNGEQSARSLENTEENCVSNQNVVQIDPKAILRSIQEQNERLAKRDKKFEALEKNASFLLTQTKNTVRLGEQLNDTLDVLINRPSSSNILSHTGQTILLKEDPINSEIEVQGTESARNDLMECVKSADDRDNQNTNLESASEPCVTEQSVRSTNSDEISSRLDEDVIQSTKKSDPVKEITNEEDTSMDRIAEECEPSTSEMNHEARFAARDIRLKRLEEQTKSLVKRVNKTTSKGVKIHYKLEELHNIYGSENSRSGTPFDENDNSSESNDDDPNQ